MIFDTKRISEDTSALIEAKASCCRYHVDQGIQNSTADECRGVQDRSTLHDPGI